MADEVVEHVVEAMRADPPASRDEVEELKRAACRAVDGAEKIPTNREILGALDGDDELVDLLRTKPVRTAAGVAVVAVMSDPAGCPHGTCTFCPGGVRWEGPEGTVDVPQSYTGHEPAAKRGRRHGYDAYEQATARLQALETNGHVTDKVDVIVMGGTFPARDRSYQDRFIQGIYDGLNGRRSDSLAEAKRRNEQADRRCVGLTIETKPDWCKEPHLDRMLEWGATRVEIGAQTLDDEVLSATNRGHTVEDTREATRLARDAGLKICYHVMPGLPGSSREQDLATFDRLFDDPAYRPDMLKIYPTLVVPGTELHRDWQAGEFEPIGDAEAADRVAHLESKVPPWVRIQRVDRDIPTHQIAAGVEKTNLRQLARERMEELGLTCDCIRCREVGLKAVKEGHEVGDLELRRTAYEAAGGREVFLSVGDEATVAGYLRLRLSRGGHRDEIRDAAIVRELKVVGQAVPIGAEPAEGPQHRGIGSSLMETAERAARDAGFDEICVTSGVGTRAYYRKLGYERQGPYVVKHLP